MRAIDSDKSNNIKEKYSLASSGNSANDASIMHHFSVNQDHGWITLVNKLDYEVIINFYLIIKNGFARNFVGLILSNFVVYFTASI